MSTTGHRKPHSFNKKVVHALTFKLVALIVVDLALLV
jgi:hypothetical protein